MDFCGHAGCIEMRQNCVAAGLYRGAWQRGDGVYKRWFKNIFCRLVARSLHTFTRQGWCGICGSMRQCSKRLTRISPRRRSDICLQSSFRARDQRLGRTRCGRVGTIRSAGGVISKSTGTSLSALPIGIRNLGSCRRLNPTVPRSLEKASPISQAGSFHSITHTRIRMPWP